MQSVVGSVAPSGAQQQTVAKAALEAGKMSAADISAAGIDSTAAILAADSLADGDSHTDATASIDGLHHAPMASPAPDAMLATTATAPGADDTETPDVVRQLAEARVALAERDCEVDALHRQTLRLADKIDRLTTGMTTGEKRDAVASELNERLLFACAELAAARADAAEARDALQEAALAAAEARAAADSEAITAAGLARQVTALRIVLAECVTEERARAEAAAERERELSETAAAAQARVATAEAAAAAAESARAALSKQLDETRRELMKLTGTTGSCSWVGDADAAGRALLLQHRAEAAAERRAEQLAELLMEREEQLSYYKRHVTALEGHLLEARQEAAEAVRQIATMGDQPTPSAATPTGTPKATEAGFSVSAGSEAAVASVGGTPPLAASAGGANTPTTPRLGATVQQQQQQQQADGVGTTTPRRAGRDAQDTIARLKDELRAKDKALKEARTALEKADCQIYGLKVVQTAKTAVNNKLEGEVWNMDSRLRTAAAEIARLEAALSEAMADAETARGDAEVSEEKAAAAAGQVAAARLQVAALLEGLLHDHQKATRADPEGYAQLRSETADILTHLPSDESRQRYAVLYRDTLLTALQQGGGHRAGAHGGRAASTTAAASRRCSTGVGGGGEGQEPGSSSWLTGGTWLLQAAGFRRRSSSCCGTAGGAAISGGGGGSEWGSAAGGSGGGLLSPNVSGHHHRTGGHRSAKNSASGVPRPSTSCGTIAEDCGPASRVGSGTRSGAGTPRAATATAGLVRHPSAQLP